MPFTGLACLLHLFGGFGQCAGVCFGILVVYLVCFSPNTRATSPRLTSFDDRAAAMPWALAFLAMRSIESQNIYAQGWPSPEFPPRPGGPLAAKTGILIVEGWRKATSQSRMTGKPGCDCFAESPPSPNPDGTAIAANWPAFFRWWGPFSRRPESAIAGPR